MVGYGGQGGAYTDLESLTDPGSGTVAAGTYLATTGPGGAGFYNPASGVGMARAAADAANEYADALNPLGGYSASQYAHDVGQVFLGEYEGARDMVKGTAHLIAHPIASFSSGVSSF